MSIRSSGQRLNECFSVPPGYRETIEEIQKAKEAERLAAEEAKLKEPEQKKKKNGTPLPREPEGVSIFPKGSLVDVDWGGVWGWRGPYVVRSGLKYGNKLVKVANSATGSTAFVSEKRLRRNQVKTFK